ncbi:EAL domain-containing protein [Halomonas huangheensis]|uniref:Diguanylate cyclase n=1 Tax=Halomonas huangheensis TaxID=1178482 RepID=W1N351_9GAMM|nr:EAL domain-containing protein [Halomonas huangheensis]ALM51483.1 hypothetical protein AR456_03605 [Halomonas huangheensis]ERL49938.1 hypothetical protein BJB45_02095 [Halomonas huangheensis]
MPTGNNTTTSISRRYRQAVLLYGLSLLLLVVGLSWVIRAQYLAELQAAEQRLSAKSALMVELIESTFSTSSQSLLGLADMLDSTAGGPLPGHAALSELLNKRNSTLPYIDDLIITDLTGRIVARSAPRLGQPLSIHQFDIYRNLQRAEDGFVVSPVYWASSAEGYRILIARWLKDGSGQIRAAGLARLTPVMLSNLLGELDLVDGESIAIVDEKAQLVARLPESNFALGDVINGPDTALYVNEEAATTRFMEYSPIDGDLRLYVSMRAGNLPLWVVLGQGIHELVMGLVIRLWPLVFTGLLLALMGMILLRHLFAQWRIEQALRSEVVERQRAEQEAQSGEAHLQTLMNSMQDLILVLTVEGRFTYVHAGNESQLLAPPAEMIGMHYSDLLPEHICERVDATFRQVLQAGSPQRVDYRLEFDESPAWFSALLSPVLDSEGKIDAVLVVVRDVTEDRDQQVQLSIAATAFETHLGMMITDEHGVILKVNRTFTEITGYSEDEVRGRNPRMLSAGRHDGDFYRRLWEQVSRHGSWQGEIWNRRKNNQVYPQWLTISAVRDANDNLTHYVGTLSDITERKAAEREIHQLAFYDPLTGLPNRRLMLNRLEEALASGEQKEQYGAMLFLDVDNFKQINDSLGHHGGDDILQAAAERMESVLRDGDTLARLGGDEFVAVLRDCGRDPRAVVEVVQDIAQQMLGALGMPFVRHQQPLLLTASIGITLFHGRTSTDELLRQADMALFQAKSLGTNQVCFFDPELQARLQERTQLENDLGQALEERQLFLVYQCQVDEHGDTVGAEALLRWRHPERGLVSPAEFIPLAESRQLIHKIGLWVIESACEVLVKWAQQPALADLTLSVNVSPLQFQALAFVDQVREILSRTRAPAHRLKLEVTESLFVDDRDDICLMMEELKNLGVTFSLDDFGTGYSSLAYLKRLPLDQLKIDQSFVRDLLESSTSSAIVASTIALAHSLDLDVIAEGVEREDQRAWLLEHGCRRFQGYLFGTPATLDEGDLIQR